MKRIYRRVTLISILCLLTGSCQKDTLTEYNFENKSATNVRYSLDREEKSKWLCGDDEWTSFLDSMFEYAEQGVEIVLCKKVNNNKMYAASDVQTFVTRDREQAISWCDSMLRSGYTVTLSYDEETREYKCIAIR